MKSSVMDIKDQYLKQHVCLPDFLMICSHVMLGWRDGLSIKIRASV